MTKTWLEGVATGGGRAARGASKVGLFCRPDILTLLGKMAHDCLVSIQTVPGCIGVGEAIKGVAVAGFDGVEPCLLDRKAQAGMIETNLGTYAGEIKAVWVCRRPFIIVPYKCTFVQYRRTFGTPD
jgi:hypothetical protein